MSNIVLGSLFFLLVIGIVCSVHKKSDLKLFYFYIIIAFLFEIILFISASFGLQNHWLANIYVPIELIVLSELLKNWTISDKMKLSIFIFRLVFLVSWILIFATDDFAHISPHLLLFEGLGIVLFTGYFLVQLMSTISGIPFVEPKFWISAGIFIFFGGTLILSSCIGLLFNQSELSVQFGEYYSIVLFILNITSIIFYLIGFRCHYKQRMLEL